ncbi:MAG: hypothetical protein K2J80_14415 [Oscillospiraceae bacterium]|nr:hypothetical protein [Oscillospiraceae bacterium]
MAVECGVIVGIFLLLALIFFRRRHFEWGIATLPLMLLPFADFVLELVIIKMFKVEVTAFVAILVLFCAVAMSAAWIGAASASLKNKHSKRTAATFIGISNLFNVLLAAILILDILNRAGQLEAVMS